MSSNLNFIILNIDAYPDYETRDMAGSMRVRNLFNPLIEKKGVSLSNLIMLDLFGMDYNDHKQTTNKSVDCLSIGYRSAKYPLSVFRYFKKGIRFIKAHYKKDATNIVYNYQHPDIRNFLFLLYAKYKGFKIVLDIVEDKKHEDVKTLNDKIRRILSLFFMKLLPYYSDAIFVISNHLLKELKGELGSRVPIYLLPISVDFKNIDNSNKGNKEVGLIKIFYGGSFGAKDGLNFLIEAIEILKKSSYNFKLVMSGKTDPNQLEKFFSTIKSPELIDYRGFLSFSEYFKLLGSVDICCMTRNNSAFANAGFPFKLGEFLAAGKLIVASRIGDVDKYLTHKENAYLVKPECTEEIVAGLQYYMDDLEILSETIGGRARGIAEKYFNAEVSSKFMFEKCQQL